ncbi:HD-GYP domain-containing protein [Geosporobacter ferrireducens]|uniref:HD/PDEase domain-containing protein n=1 Tax=Geosporobacter ferrireducens TaxID=1424294 RepID=A0A1D8GPR4_9FIRM|nr:HD domain-containing protein [Geosporobacter ferrireducens]AOT72905.1 hypothetical protein Gferi_27115 [Geosporobacter ferrireducens]MTI55311.1 HD domain-containing protein [Geosporobacter ferrireducens]
MRLAKIDDNIIGKRLGSSISTIDGRKLVNGQIEITGKVIQRLQSFGMNALYIEDKNTDVELKETVSDEQRGVILKRLNLVYEKISKESFCDEFEIGKILRQEIIPSINNEPVSIAVGQKTKGFDLAQHSLNLCLLVLVTGMKFGLSMDKIEMLGKAALFHDIGKLIKNDSNEGHEQKGYTFLKNKANSPMLYSLVRFHHETIDGGGPQKLRNEHQTDLIKILSLCDYYESLVSIDGLVPSECYENIQALVNIKFDHQVYEAFRKSVYLYPVGLPIKLNNGEEGVVIRQNTAFPLRPFVRTDYKEYNLIEHLSLFIDKVIL